MRCALPPQTPTYLSRLQISYAGVMEAKKVEETRTLVRQASALLHEHLQNLPHTPLSYSERSKLRDLLRLLLPSLSIVRSFEHRYHFRCVYMTIENAVEQVLTCPALSEADTLPDDDERPINETSSASRPSEAAQLTSPAGETAPIQADAAEDTVPLWRDIYGCKEAILALRQSTTLPLRYPALFTGPRRPWRCLLLYGPPGTGKTQLAAATAAEFNAVFLSMSAADLLSKWVGESEKQVRLAFTRAAAAGPRCVLFFDEVDALCSARGGQGESELARRLKTEFLLQLQKVAATVVVLAATNLPWELDAAIVRRFDRLVHVGLPSLEEKLQFMRDRMRGVTHVVTDDQLRRVAGQTEGFSLVDLGRLLSNAVMAPVTEWLSRHSSVECVSVNGDAARCEKMASAGKCEDAAFLPASSTAPPLSLPCRLRCVDGESGKDKNQSEALEVLGDASIASEKSPNTGLAAASVYTSSSDTQAPAEFLHEERPFMASDTSSARVCEFGVPPVEAKHFEEALRRVAATTTAADAARYSSWYSHSA
ncbi:ATPase-like protein [Leptomonas seymouri]|uniref:ATPase-like protein n=1 Tax=Leptomonas seymouri TaxID=5684 RepID=A0A0N0P643_LEPSE|nr:ATPase-like protein [Leptomonas seymouri]|eukprot:KPI86727.1 ATPase-like protein [Leptomonas seymouri]